MTYHHEEVLTLVDTRSIRRETAVCWHDLCVLRRYYWLCVLLSRIQDAVLFAGSVRENLDPFNEYSDERLYTVLEQCQLKAYVMEQTEKLLYDCGEGGKNLR